MDIVKIVGMGLVATVMVVLLRQEKPEIAVQMSIVIGVIIFLMMLDKIAAVIDILKDLSRRANIEMVYMSTILKIIGISYIAEFGSQICKDAGSSATASKIELAAKVMIMVLSLPILIAVLDLILKIVP